MGETAQISRRRFIQLSTLGTAALLTAHPFNKVLAASYIDYEKQIKFIENIKGYCRKELGMKLGSYFYTNWEIDDGYLFYVYVSEPNAVKVPEGIQEFYYFGTDAKAAQAASDNFALKGYHTMVYQTAGTSATLLNKGLMSYSMEAISLIVFHEALHVHLRETRRNIPLSIEEAAADVIAKYVTRDFQKTNDQVKKRSLKRTIKIMERIYKSVNNSCDDLEKGKLEQEIVFNRCYKRVKKSLIKSNNYQKVRFSYPVNNAYFVRNSYYSKYYFDLEKLYKKLNKSPERFIDFVSKLPNDLDSALFMIKNQTLIS